MARIVGINLPENKRIEIALTYIYGIGLTTSQRILELTQVDPNTRVKDLTEPMIRKISEVIDKEYKVEGEVKQEVLRNIKRLQEIRSYRGIRHKVGLPVRGQNTRTNCVTRKGKNIAVGGLKVKITKT